VAHRITVGWMNRGASGLLHDPRIYIYIRPVMLFGLLRSNMFIMIIL
jgi:hypothetical protein